MVVRILSNSNINFCSVLLKFIKVKYKFSSTPHFNMVLPFCKLLETPVKSPNDKKDYRVIELTNGLKALLISDLSSLKENPRCTIESEQLLQEDIKTSSRLDDEDEEIGEDELSEEEENEISDDEDRPRGKTPSEAATFLPAASLCVGSGSFSDPNEAPGLMHFLEHMLFMGSKKYPEENYFDNFVTNHGGRSNAHTCMELTTFYFEIQENFLKHGLDIFAQFFIDPLMKTDAMQRERKAVHSEFQEALPNDSNRVEMLFASMATEGHPMGKFSWGNETTLDLDMPDDDLQRWLHELKSSGYSAHYMTLCVHAREELDTLQDWVIEIFSKVQNNNKPRPTFTHLPFPFPKEKINFLYKVIPVKDFHSIEMTWALPCLREKYRIKPIHYISHLLGHEGSGSILSYLKEKVWAVGLYAGNDENDFEHNQTYCSMNVTLEVTNEGFKHIKEIIQCIFQYLRLMAETGPLPWIFKEIQTMERIDFDYAEETSPITYAQMLSESMQIFPVPEYLSGESLLIEYDAKLISDCLSCLTPDSCNIILSSKTYEDDNICNETEKWFGTKYSKEEIPAEWLQDWKSLLINEKFYMPTPNPFIPDDFSLLPSPFKKATGDESPSKDVDEKDYPPLKKIQKESWGELWFRQDFKFGLPKTICYIQMIIPAMKDSAKMAALLDLFLNLFAQQVMEVLYPATMAQYKYSLKATEFGLSIRISGFNQRLLKLLELILSEIATFEEKFDDECFIQMKEQQLKSYHNAIIKPDVMRRDVRLSILQEVHWTLVERLKALKTISKEDILSTFGKGRIFTDTHVQMLVQGNIVAGDAERMFEAVATRRKNSNLEVFPEMRTRKTPTGISFGRLISLNQSSCNTSVINYYQHGAGTLETEILNEFVLMAMDEPAFDTLRTKDQLGYGVCSTPRNTYGILGLSITVNSQADKFSCDHIDSRIESFLLSFASYLENLPQTVFDELKKTLVDSKKIIDLKLQDEVERNWGEIATREYLFDRLAKQICLIDSITLSKAVSWLRSLVSSCDNEKYRKLSIQIEGSCDPKNGKPPQIKDSLDLPIGELFNFKCPEESKEKSIFILDLNSFKKSLEFYPVSKIL